MSLTLVFQTIFAALGAGGLVQLIKALAAKRAVRVEVADKVNEMTIEWAAAVRHDAEEARKEAKEARAEVAQAWKEADDLRRQLRGVRAQVVQLERRMTSLRTASNSPEVTLELIRELINRDADTHASEQEV